MLRFISLFACAALVLAAFAGGATILMKYGVQAQSRGCQSSGGCRDIAFDSRDWQTYGTLTQPIRLWMLQDLLSGRDLAHQTHDWVAANLGTPDKNDRLAGRCDSAYWLGPVQALVNVNSNWLCIRFTGDYVAEATVLESP